MMIFRSPSSVIFSWISYALMIRITIMFVTQVETAIVKPTSDNDNGRGQQVAPENLEDDQLVSQGKLSRPARKLARDKNSMKVIMIMKDENYSFIENDIFSATDYIIRLQEKYDYVLCTEYVQSISTNIRDQYFSYNTELVSPLEGDLTYIQEKENKTKATLPNRYRMYGEECDEANEREFWKMMFVIAENDTNKFQKDPGVKEATLQPTDFVYLKFSRKFLMDQWNNVWKNFSSQKVCNQRLLLECIGNKCECRKNALGRMTIAPKVVGGKVQPRPSDPSAVRYYYDNSTYINDESVIDFTHYKYEERCALKASEDSKPNPCDFFLPMIGECLGSCVENASCASVGETEKIKTEESANKYKTNEKRIQEGMHDKYHNKCVCRKGFICEQRGTDKKNASGKLNFSFILVMASAIVSTSFYNILTLFLVTTLKESG